MTRLMDNNIVLITISNRALYVWEACMSFYYLINSSTKNSKESHAHSEILCQGNIRSVCLLKSLNVAILFIAVIFYCSFCAIIIINDKQFTSIECQSLSETDPLVLEQLPLFHSPFPPMTQQDTIPQFARYENNLSREKNPRAFAI